MSIERGDGSVRRRRTASIVSLLVIALVGAPLTFWLSVGADDVAVVAVLALGVISLAEIAASWIFWDAGGPC